MRPKFIVILITLFMSLPILGQDKNEREERVKEEDFPAKAVQALKDAMQEDVSIRYYKEYDGEAESYEAKFKWRKRNFSIEFDTTGVVQDVEIRISRKDVPNPTVTKIKQYLDENFDDWRMEKAQVHFSKKRNGKDLIKKSLHEPTTLIPDYELIIATKIDGKITNYEMLFSKSGDLILKRIVVNRSHDFLRF